MNTRIIFIFLIVSVFSFFSCKGKKQPENIKIVEADEEYSLNAKRKTDLPDEKTENDEIERLIQEVSEAETEYEEAELPEIKIPASYESDIVIGTDNSLKMFFFEDEILSPQVNSEYKIVVSANKEKVSRSFYDKAGRLCRMEKWLIPDVESAKLIKKQIFYFSKDSYTTERQILTEGDYTSYINYNEKSKPVEIKKYRDNGNIIVEETSYSYDGEDRIVENKSLIHNYDEVTGKETDLLEKKYIYFYYHEKDIPPDFEYYESNVLKIKNIYSSEKGKYTSQIFFDDNYNVKTYFKNDVKYREVYTLNDVVVRDVKYE